MNDFNAGRPRAPSDHRAIDLLPWLPPIIAVGLLSVLLVVAGLRLVPGAPAQTQLPAPPAAQPGPISAPAPASAPGRLASSANPTPSSPAAGARLPDRSPAAGSRTASTRPAGRTVGTATRPAPATVTGRYQVLNSYQDAFIGEVLITNIAQQPRDWVVELTFPAAVGALVTSWVESAPQATLERTGTTYRWTSGVPVEPQASVALRFHFKRSGTGNSPLTCTVNATGCNGFH